MVYDYNPGLSRGYGDNTTAVRAEELRLPRFFINYQSHSEQLADALQEWSDRLRFTSCKYENGFLDTENSVEIPPSDRGFMRYMKKHLEMEERIKTILTTAYEIETSHREQCKNIQETMISDAPISISPSFQKIITDKIQRACPTLKKSRDVNLTESNIYLDFYIFKVIFEKVSRNESVITLSVDDSGRRNWVLMYQKSFALGQGEESDMNRLKKVVEELITDNNIKERVQEHDRLNKQLITDDRIMVLKNQIEELWTFIHGGGYLGGFDACELCDPSKSAPRRI